MTRNHRMAMRNFFLTVALIFIAFACTDGKTYYKFQPVDATGWHKDSAAVFDVDIADSIQSFDVLINVRNGGEYPYQNLWLFIKRTGPDKLVLNDTVECYIADPMGKWKGSGIGSRYEVSVLYQQNQQFGAKGIYHFEIRQGMREEKLKGLYEIGFMVKNVQK